MKRPTWVLAVELLIALGIGAIIGYKQLPDDLQLRPECYGERLH